METKDKVTLASANLNGITRNKLVKTLDNFFSENNFFPDFLALQEAKSLVPPEIAGYSVVHSLDNSCHGAVMYLKSNFQFSVLHADHNSQCVRIKGEPVDLVICNAYIPFSLRSSWKDFLGEIFEACATLDNLPILFCTDLNHERSSSAFEDFVFTALCGHQNIVDPPTSPTCRDASSPDHIIGRFVKGKIKILHKKYRTDHNLIWSQFFLPSIPVTKKGQEFYCMNLENCFDLIDKMWEEINIQQISDMSIDANGFFLSLEIAVRTACIRNNLFKLTPSLNNQISSTLAVKLSKVLSKNHNQQTTLKSISSLTNPAGSPFAFAEIDSALAKAENLPIPSDLLASVSRIKKSKEPLIFEFAELWSIISGLNSNKSSGPSFLSAKILKRMPFDGVRCVCMWFSRISQFGYPEFFRIHKAIGTAKSDGSVRPICVIGVIAKCYDICLLNRLEPILSVSLPDNQAAYLRHRRGAEDNLGIVKTLSLLFPDLVIVLTDFSKAFNTVPNLVILNALESLGVDGSLLDAVMDALLSFKICNLQENSYSDFERGVKQGGVSSGLIFTSVMISLTEALDLAPLVKPIFLGGRKLSHLIFADDVVLLTRCQEDAKILSEVVEAWTLDHGMILNKDKCRILPGYKSNNLWYKAVTSAPYLGVTLSYDSEGFRFTRRNSNHFYAYKLRPCVKHIIDIKLFRNLIKIFNSGPYGHTVVSSDVINKARTVGELCDATKKHDKHWLTLVRFFFSISHRELLSLPRVTAELGLSSARFGCSLVAYCDEYRSYILNLPCNSFIRLAYEAGTTFTASLDKAHDFRAEIEFWPTQLTEGSWVLIPKKERNLIAKIVFSIYASENIEYRAKLLSYAANKEYTKIRHLVKLLTKIS